MELEFSNPPQDRREQRTAEWKRITTELRANPGQWAKVGNFSPGVATAIRRGKYRAFLDPDDNITEPETYMRQHWEIRTHKTGDGTRNDIYIRWNG